MQSNILWGGVKVSTGSKVCEGQFCPRTGVIPVPTVIVRMRKEIKAAFLRAPVKGCAFFCGAQYVPRGRCGAGCLQGGVLTSATRQRQGGAARGGMRRRVKEYPKKFF